jgi:hypothetical protein
MIQRLIGWVIVGVGAFYLFFRPEAGPYPAPLVIYLIGLAIAGNAERARTPLVERSPAGEPPRLPPPGTPFTTGQRVLQFIFVVMIAAGAIVQFADGEPWGGMMALMAGVWVFVATGGR